MEYVKYTPAIYKAGATMIASQLNYKSAGTTQYYAYLWIFGGTVPTPAQINAANAAFLSSKGSSLLINFNLTGLNAVSVNSDGCGLTVAARPYTAAARTGTATWFGLYSTAGENVIIGDISDLNGTGFMKMETTDIVAGGLYKITNPLVMKFPTEYQMG